MKSSSMKEQVTAAEKLMKMCWVGICCTTGNGCSRKRGIVIFAQMRIRTALFLCKKSGKWEETRVFKSLQEIQEVFIQEVEAAKSQGESPRPFRG